MTIRSFSPVQMYSGALTPGGATFQAHNRLCVRTAYGYFYSYTYKMTGVAVGQSAGLWFSPDGVTPPTLLDSYGIFGGGAPAVLADKLGDIYWLVADDQSTTLLMRKYFYSNGSGGMDRIQRNWPGYVSTKWTAMYSEYWDRIYLFTFYPPTNFAVFDSSLNLLNHYQLTQNGSLSEVEYPFLAKDKDIIAAGWVTTAVTATSPGYDGMHYILNNYGGVPGNWYTPQDGVMRTPPITSDNTGPTPEMRQSFTPAADSVWLGAMTLTNRLNIHMAYADPNGPAPVTETEFCYHSLGLPGSWARLSLHDNLLQGGATSKVAGATLTIQELRGSSAGYFKGGDGALYMVGPSKEVDADGLNRINVLRKTDVALPWEDFAQSDRTFNIYALNIMREGIEQTGGGWANGDQIVGLFTHISNPGAATPQQVYSFHIPIAP